MKCPHCGGLENWKMARYSWMGRIPKLRNRRCSSCGREYAGWLGFLPMTHATARWLVFLWIVLVSALSVVASVLAVVWLVNLRHAGVW